MAGHCTYNFKKYRIQLTLQRFLLFLTACFNKNSETQTLVKVDATFWW